MRVSIQAERAARAGELSDFDIPGPPPGDPPGARERLSPARLVGPRTAAGAGQMCGGWDNMEANTLLHAGTEPPT